MFKDYTYNEIERIINNLIDKVKLENGKYINLKKMYKEMKRENERLAKQCDVLAQQLTTQGAGGTTVCIIHD